MNSKQRVHIGMVNSLKLLTGKVSMDELIRSRLAILSHSPEDERLLESIKFIIFYFEENEMFEECAELQQYISNTFDDSGNFKIDLCQCEMPNIKEYTSQTKCSICNLNLLR